MANFLGSLQLLANQLQREPRKFKSAPRKVPLNFLTLRSRKSRNFSGRHPEYPLGWTKANAEPSSARTPRPGPHERHSRLARYRRASGLLLLPTCAAARAYYRAPAVALMNTCDLEEVERRRGKARVPWSARYYEGISMFPPRERRYRAAASLAMSCAPSRGLTIWLRGIRGG
jgi:hypothetical protein